MQPSSLLKNILYREIGKSTIHAIPNAEINKRSRSLELSKAKEIHSAHQAPVLCLDIDNVETRYLLSGGSDSQIVLYDLQEPVNQNGHSFGVSTIQWYPVDTGMFISGAFDKKIKVWDTNNLVVACEFELTEKLYDISLSRVASHMLIAAGSGDQKVRLCDLKTAKATHSLIGHREAVWAVEWSPSNDYLLATGSVDKTVRVWDIRRSSSCLLILDQHNSNSKPESFTHSRPTVTTTAHNAAVTSLCFTSTGQYLISAGNDNRMRLWNLATGMNTLVNYPNAINRTPKSNQITISNNGKYVYFPREQVGSLRGHLDKVNCCVFHPVSAEMYSGANDNLILTWTPSQDVKMNDEEEANTSAIDKDTWSDDEGN